MSFLNSLLSFFGQRQDQLSWEEPVSYAARVRGDTQLRTIFGLGVAGLVFLACVITMAATNNFHYLGYLLTALFVLSSGGGAYNWPTIYLNKKYGGQSISLREDDMTITSLRHGAFKHKGVIPWYGNYREVITIPYRAIVEFKLIPSEVLNTGFSIVMLQLADEGKIFAMPNWVDRNRVKRILSAHRVNMILGSSPPADMKYKINDKMAYGFGIVGGVCGVIGIFVGLIGAAMQPPLDQLQQQQQQAAAAPVNENKPLFDDPRLQAQHEAAQKMMQKAHAGMPQGDRFGMPKRREEAERPATSSPYGNLSFPGFDQP